MKKNWLRAIILGIGFCAAIMVLPDTATEKTENINIEADADKETSEASDLIVEVTPAETCEATPLPTPTNEPEENIQYLAEDSGLRIEEIPGYSGASYFEIDNNEPNFSDSELSTQSYEYYSELDSLGRCGVVFACIGQDIMPTEERGNIGSIKPSGWHTVKYNDLIDGNYLYNRCHLIGYQLTGENANENNLITGTRSMNIDGMVPFENMVAEYVKGTDNHVMYRVTPVFEGDNLVASGVQIEAKSVEDDGFGICFNVYVYNVQPGISIDYVTGESEVLATPTPELTSTPQPTSTPEPTSTQELVQTQVVTQEVSEEPVGTDYVLNKNTKKFHYPYCSSADDIKPKNRADFTGNRDEVLDRGYVPCKRCNP